MTSILAAAPNAGAADFSQDTWLITLLKAVLILVYLIVSVIFAIWFERRVLGRMQARPGPNVHGPFGIGQLIWDALKLLFKEDINVKKADKIVYIIAPMISVFSAVLIYSVIPMGPNVRIPFTDVSTPLQLTDFPVAVLYILAVTSIGVYGIVLGGWSSGSTYPLLGSVRSTAQVISYELAMGLSLVAVFMLAGSMSTSQIVSGQQRLWFGVMLIPSFIIYIISIFGETNRLPFDLPEGEGELVGGYHTEYSSMKFAWFYLGEYINMLNVSAVATTLFLGGWRAPWPLSAINHGMFNEGWWPLLWFLIKAWLVMFFFVWVRGTIIRIRFDQFMNLGWKVLIPASLMWLVVVGVIMCTNAFSNTSYPIWLLPVLSVLAILGAIAWFWPAKQVGTQKPEEEVIDPFAGGFPVPPLPGQKLPPSPRDLVEASVTEESVVITSDEETKNG